MLFELQLRVAINAQLADSRKMLLGSGDAMVTKWIGTIGRVWDAMGRDTSERGRSLTGSTLYGARSRQQRTKAFVPEMFLRWWFEILRLDIPCLACDLRYWRLRCEHRRRFALQVDSSYLIYTANATMFGQQIDFRGPYSSQLHDFLSLFGFEDDM